MDDEPSGLIPSSATLARVRALYDRSHRDHTRNVTIIEDWRLFQDGTVGSYKVNRLGKDVRETTSLGPLAYERGVFRGVRWEQNRNGITFTYWGLHEQRDAVSDRAFRDPARTATSMSIGDSLALNAYVVEVNPAAGRHEWLFVDKRTGNISRREYVERRRRYISTYDDYRPVDGVPEPSRVRTTDSLGNEREQILATRSLDATPDARDVEIPPSRRIVEFPARDSTVRLPVRFVNGLAVVRVIVGRGAYDFLLDTAPPESSSTRSSSSSRAWSRAASGRLDPGNVPGGDTIVPDDDRRAAHARRRLPRREVPFHIDNRTQLAGLLNLDFFADTSSTSTSQDLAEPLIVRPLSRAGRHDGASPWDSTTAPPVRVRPSNGNRSSDRRGREPHHVRTCSPSAGLHARSRRAPMHVRASAFANTRRPAFPRSSWRPLDARRNG